MDKMDETDGVQHEDALFVCSHCRHLTYYPNGMRSVEYQQESASIPGSVRKISMAGKTTRFFRFSIRNCTRELPQALCTIDDENLKNNLPACKACMALYSEKISKKKEFYAQQNQLVVDNPNVFISTLPMKIKKKIEDIRENVATYKEAYENSRSNTESANRRRFSVDMVDLIPDESNFTDSLLLSNLSQIDPLDESTGIKWGSVQLYTTYLIGFKRQYGTINSMRLGQNTPDFVPYHEIDIGLFFLTSLLRFICEKQKINNTYLDIDKDTVLYLDYSGKQCTMSASCLKHRKEIPNFNVPIGYMFKLVKDIADSIGQSLDSRSAFHPINLKEKKIGGIPYEYDRKIPSQWTQAMKYLLYNVKIIQLLALKRAML